MTPRVHPSGDPAGLSLAEALAAEAVTVVDLVLLERLYLDLAVL